MDPFLGAIVLFGGNFAPRGWAFCEGQLLPISQNTALFSILGTTYGGDGRTTFALPDLRGRVPMHPGHGPGLASRRLGQKGGAENNSIQVTNLPAHHHVNSISASSNPADTKNAEGAFLPTSPRSGGVDIYASALGTPKVMGAAGNTANTGGNQPINNMQPFNCINFIIALQGTFPSRS